MIKSMFQRFFQWRPWFFSSNQQFVLIPSSNLSGTKHTSFPHLFYYNLFYQTTAVYKIVAFEHISKSSGLQSIVPDWQQTTAHNLHKTFHVKTWTISTVIT